MEIRTNVKPGGITLNHNEAIFVRTGVKAGALTFNHNEAMAVCGCVRSANLAPALI